MNDENKSTEEPRETGKVPSRSAFYSMVSPYGKEAVETLVEAMRKGNWSVKTGAAKTILAKIIPDLKSTELTGADGQQFTIKLIRDYITQTGGDVPPSDTSIKGSEPVQGSNMASESKKDIDITGEDGNRMP